MRILKILGVVLGLLIVGGIVYLSVQDPVVVVHRETVIDRSPADVFAVVDDYKQFAAWSPWQKLDPNMKVTYGEKSTGLGASYSWDSQVKEAGAGSMTTTWSEPGKGVASELKFTRPWESTSVDTIFLAPEGNGTRVRWVMHSPMPFAMRFMNGAIAEGVGKDYDEGLANLKRYVESKPAAAPDTTAAAAPAAAGK